MLDDKLVPQINITFKCNMYQICDYCYIRELKRQLPLHMSGEDFSRLLEWLVALGVDEIILLGGEPTLHPSFAELIRAVETADRSARMFTNGSYERATADLLSANRHIQTVFFHYDESYLSPANGNRQRFLDNLRSASRSGKKIWLRWNIDSTNADHSEVVSLAEEYSASIGYSISVPVLGLNRIPILEVHQYAASLVRFVESASERHIDIQPGRAMPLCGFSPEQLDFLRAKGNVQGQCVAINDLTVNTDLSLQLCSVTHSLRTTRVSGLSDLQEKIEFLKEREQELRAKPSIPECDGCSFFEAGTCQGGCYGYKLYGGTHNSRSGAE